MHDKNTSTEEIRKPMKARRTVVGSGPARKPLAYGREAIERAIRHCEFWRCNTANLASEHAWRRLAGAGRIPYMPWTGEDWWPGQITHTTVAKLRELLRGMPPRRRP